MECLGYSHLDDASDKSTRPRVKPAAARHASSKPASAIAGPSHRPTTSPLTGPPGIPSLPSGSTPLWANPHSPTTGPTGGLWPSVPTNARGIYPKAGTASTPDDVLDFSFLSDPATTMFVPQGASASWWDTDVAMSTTSAYQSHEPLDITPNASHNQLFGVSQSNLPDPSRSLDPHRAPGASLDANPTHMTSGQASLFHALFSLGESQTASPNPSNSTAQTPPSSHGSTWPSPDTEQDEESSVTSEESDPEGVREIVCRTPTLDRNVPANSLPFILQSCACIQSLGRHWSSRLS
jgi:hypothetical protein